MILFRSPMCIADKFTKLPNRNATLCINITHCAVRYNGFCLTKGLNFGWPYEDLRRDCGAASFIDQYY